MNKTLILIKRECLTRVKTKAFIIGTLLAPVLFILLVFLPGILMNVGGEGERTIAVADLTKKLYAPLEARVAEAKKEGKGNFPYNLVSIGTENQNLDSIKAGLNRKILKGQLHVFLVLPQDIFESNRFESYMKNTGNFQLNESINNLVSSMVSSIRISESGLDPAQIKKLNQRVRASTFSVGKSGAKKENAGVTFMLSYLLAFFIYFALIYYGMFVMRGVIEDKSSRVVEILLSSARPHQIMAGKILGIGLVGLIQIGVWGLCILAASTYGLVIVKHFAPAAKSIPIPSVSVWVILSFVLFFMIGYFIYAAIYAALGSLASSDTELQNLQLPGMAPILLSFMLMFAILKNPDGTMATVLSLIPLFSPILMFTRISAHAAPLWQVLLSIGLCFATIAGLVWISARIFRIGILMYGKRPTLPEVLKWIRYS